MHNPNLYIIIALFAFVIAELAAYFWHRYMAHTTLLSKILPTEAIAIAHQFHHKAPLDHDASEDFVWIIYGMILILVTYGVLYNFWLHRYLNTPVMLVIIITAALVFIYNWYVHLAVHTEDHWTKKLGTYVEDMKSIHFVHHRMPRRNYSIINFTDTLCGTYSSGFMYTQHEVENILGRSGTEEC